MSENMVIGFQMLVVGMSGVFIVLAFFAGLIWVMKEINRRMAQKPQIALATMITSEEVRLNNIAPNDDLLLVLSSVAVSVLGKKVKVKKIHFLNQGSADDSWSITGRQDVLTSHNIIKKG